VPPNRAGPRYRTGIFEAIAGVKGAGGRRRRGAPRAPVAGPSKGEPTDSRAPTRSRDADSWGGGRVEITQRGRGAELVEAGVVGPSPRDGPFEERDRAASLGLREAGEALGADPRDPRERELLAGRPGEAERPVEHLEVSRRGLLLRLRGLGLR